MQQQVPDLVARRKKQMTHPEQWDQLIRDLNAMYDRMVYEFDRATFTMSMKPKAGGETQPGSRFAYSGEGIALAQMVVETVTGKSVGELMNERIRRTR
jgi:CubicO group peptidase (beta-lactamase class C family)